jgi:protein disulfide-isomerase
MAKFIVLIYALLLTFNLSAAPSKINWITSYEEAVNQSNTTSKPILLFFTGSDWCSWCHKLEAEVLNTPEFQEAASDKFIFVILDFPMSTKLDSNLSAQNKQLQKKYDVRGFPTIVLVDGKGQKIGVTGYRAGGGKQYAEHLFKMLSEFSGYQQKLSQLEKQNFSGQELKHLYEKAQEFGLESDTNKIIAAGFHSDQRPFFLLERYRFLASEGKNDSVEAVNLKKQLLLTDPSNEHLTHYQLAIIDFETLAAIGENQKKPADFFISPLVDYIEKFGAEDKTNIWRLHMIIAQVYYDKNKQEEALTHAKSAMTSAPLGLHSEINIVIKNIEQTTTN